MIGMFNGKATTKTFGLVALVSLLAFAAPLSAQVAPNGRWEFVVTSGDTPYQLNQAGQVTFSTYLNLYGTTLSGMPQQTTNTTSAEIYCCNDTVTGTFTKHNNTSTAVVQFSVPTIPQVGQVAFNYTFTGTFNPDPNNSNGPTITGTYATNVGPTYSLTGSGTFVATWFPDFPHNPVEYIGGLAGPDTGSGPTDVPAQVTLGTDPGSHDLIGTVNVPLLTNSNGVACFTGPLTIQTLHNPQLLGAGGAVNGVGVPFASGVGITIFAEDTAGNQLSLIGYSAKPNENSAAVGESYFVESDNSGDNTTTFNGSNQELIMYYGITGGPCDGYGGGDAPFHPSTKHEHHNKHERHHGNR